MTLDRRSGRVRAGHTGAMPGFLSALWVDRGTRSVAVALTNVTRGVPIADVASDALDLLLAAVPEPAVQPWRPAPPCPPELAGVLGRWWSEADETVFSWLADGLHAHLASAPASTDTRFVPQEGDLFRAVAGRMTGELLRIRRGGNGDVVGLEWATYPFTRESR